MVSRSGGQVKEATKDSDSLPQCRRNRATSDRRTPGDVGIVNAIGVGINTVLIPAHATPFNTFAEATQDAAMVGERTCLKPNVPRLRPHETLVLDEGTARRLRG